MDWYEPEVRALENRIRGGLAPHNAAAFYGSSSIRMWDCLAEDLQDRRAFNLGFGGSTLAACAHFFQRLVPLLDPQSLVVYAGDNDLGDGKTPDEVFAAFVSLVSQAASLSPTLPLGFISIKVSPARVGLREKILRTNEMIHREIGTRPQCFYIDVVEAMLDAKGAPRPELFLEDGLHLSRPGYRLWANLLEPFRNQIFSPQLQESHV